MLTSTFARKLNVRVRRIPSVHIGPGRGGGHLIIGGYTVNRTKSNHQIQRRRPFHRRRRPRRLRTRCDSKPPRRNVCLTRTIDRSGRSFRIILLLLLPRGYIIIIIIITTSGFRVSLITGEWRWTTFADPSDLCSRKPNNNTLINNIIKRPVRSVQKTRLRV